MNMQRQGRALNRSLAQEVDHPISYHIIGAVRLAHSHARMMEFNREGQGIEADFSVPAQQIIRSLDRIIEWRGKPSTTRFDIGPEYKSEKQMK